MCWLWRNEGKKGNVSCNQNSRRRNIVGYNREKERQGSIYMFQSGMFAESREKSWTGTFIKNCCAERNDRYPYKGDGESLKQDKILSMLGLAEKAGKIASGEFCSEKAVKSGKAFLVIVAADASDNTKKMFRNMCEFYHVPMYTYATKDELGHYIGKQYRASLAVTDEGFSRTLEMKLKMLTKTE